MVSAFRIILKRFYLEKSKLLGDSRRVDLTGDSQLVVSWFNGHWPTRNRWFGDVIDGCVERMAVLWQSGVRPRQDWAPFARRMKRKFSTQCDALASAGKQPMESKLELRITDTKGE